MTRSTRRAVSTIRIQRKGEAGSVKVYPFAPIRLAQEWGVP
jgi:hypothetical protein